MENGITWLEYPKNGIYFYLREEKTTGVLSWKPSQLLTPPHHPYRLAALGDRPTRPAPFINPSAGCCSLLNPSFKAKTPPVTGRVSQTFRADGGRGWVRVCLCLMSYVWAIVCHLKPDDAAPNPGSE